MACIVSILCILLLWKSLILLSQLSYSYVDLFESGLYNLVYELMHLDSFNQVYSEHLCHLWGGPLWRFGLALQQHCYQGKKSIWSSSSSCFCFQRKFLEIGVYIAGMKDCMSHKVLQWIWASLYQSLIYRSLQVNIWIIQCSVCGWTLAWVCFCLKETKYLFILYF